MKRISKSWTQEIAQAKVLTIQLNRNSRGGLSTLVVDALRADGRSRTLRLAAGASNSGIDLIEAAQEALAAQLRQQVEEEPKLI